MIKEYLTSDNRKGGLLARLFRLNTVWGDETILVNVFRRSGIEVQEPQVIRTPYMTSLRIAPRRFIHIFWRADLDPDWHDHQWDFQTFPIWPRKGYMEEYLEGPFGTPETCVKQTLVSGWQWTFRPAEHAHRITGTWDGNWPLITFVVKGPKRRSWGFYVRRDGKWCYQDWQKYLLWGGKEHGCD